MTETKPPATLGTYLNGAEMALREAIEATHPNACGRLIGEALAYIRKAQALAEKNGA